MEQFATSPVAQVIIAIVPIVGIFIGGITVFFYLLWRHHEITLQIKTGTFLQRKFDMKSFSLLAGLLLSGVGLTITLVFLVIGGFTYAVLGGLIPAALGIGLLVFYKINPDFRADGPFGADK